MITNSRYRAVQISHEFLSVFTRRVLTKPVLAIVKEKEGGGVTKISQRITNDSFRLQFRASFVPTTLTY